MADLLQVAIDDQWSGESNIDCHCHPKYVAACKECNVREYDHHNPYTANEHKEDCKRLLLIKEVQAYLRVENILLEKQGEETIWFQDDE
jgi:hypothetical protein